MTVSETGGKAIAVTFPFSVGIPGGGTEGCIQIARHLAKLGARVTIVSVHGGGGGAGRKALPADHGADERAALQSVGIRVIPVRPSPLHYALDGLGVRRALRSMAAAGPLDAVIGFHHEMLFSFGVLERAGVRTGMVTAAGGYRNFHGQNPLTRRLRKRLIHACLERAGELFPPSGFIRQDLLDNPKIAPDKVHVTPWGVKGDFLETVPRPPETGFRIIFYGWWVKEKGIFDLLEALSPLAGEDWNLAVAGWGDEHRVMEAARKHGIAGRVHILGKLSHALLSKEVARSNLAVLPSYVESFGLAVAEAQAAAVPVAAYRAGAVPETVVDGSTGWLVPVGDTGKLKDAIRQAMQDPSEARQRGLRGRERVREKFTWERTAGRILEVLS